MSRKAFSLKKTSSVDKKISLFAMISIALLAIFNLQNVIDNYVGMGLSATVAFIIAVVVFLFPFIFIIAEFASLEKGSKSGLTSWIKIAIGRKMAFLTSFMFWFANLTYFFSAVPSRINYLSFAITGVDYTQDPIYNQIIPWASVGFFAIVTFLSTLNTKKISRLTSLGGALMIGLTVFFFVFAIIGWIAGAINPDLLKDTQAPGVVPDGELNIWGETKGFGFAWISTFIWVLMAADGGQSLGVYVNDVKGGRKTFIRAMLISVSLIGIAYVLGTLLTSIFPPTGGLANGWANSFANLFYFIFNPMGVSYEKITIMTNVIIGSIFFISAIGGIIVWTSAPVKVMFSEIAPGVFGQQLPRENRNGVCSFGTWIQFLIVVPLMLFLMLSKGNLSEALSLIKGAAGWIGMLPWLVIFVSYLNLRIKKEHEKRSFKMGSRTFGIIMASFLTIITSAILVLTFLDTAPLNEPYENWSPTWYVGPVLKVVMILLILVPAYCWYYFKFEYQIRDAKIAKIKNISDDCVIVKYNKSGLKNKFLYNNDFQEYENEKTLILIKGKEKLSQIYNKQDNLEKELSSTFDQLKQKDLKTQLKNVKKEIKLVTKEIKQEIRNHKQSFKNTINEKILNDSIKLKNDYEINIASSIKELKNKQKTILSDETKKTEILNKKQELKKEIQILKQQYKTNKDEKSKKEFEKKYSELLEKYNSIKIEKPYTDILNQDLDSIVKKDIEFDGLNIDDYFKELGQSKVYESSIVFDYGFLSKKIYSDKIAISKDKLLLIKNNSESLVAKEYDLKNIKCINKSCDKSISIIDNGKWIDLDKVEFIHIENTQVESFNVYVNDSKKLLSVVNAK